jgi:hypothetical protein
MNVEDSKLLAARPPDHQNSCLMFQVLLLCHNDVPVCATKDPLSGSESLVDGSKKEQPKVKVKQTPKNLERQHGSLRQRIIFGNSW